MIQETIQIGDEVVLNVPQENREWGYNPYPDGTKAKVLGFSEIAYGRLRTYGFEPGVYVNRAWVKVQLEDSRILSEWSGRLELIDKKEQKRRETQLREKRNWDQKERIRDLPETKFWEGDYIKYDDRPNEVLVIQNIDYDQIKSTRNDGSEYPIYNISSSLTARWYTSVNTKDLTLIKRGMVWDYYHGNKLTFADLKEEAEFFTLLGKTKEVRNPKNRLYRWELEEVLQAIRDGIVHGFTMANGFFGGGATIRAQIFENEELGKRVAKATLEGFKENAVS